MYAVSRSTRQRSNRYLALVFPHEGREPVIKIRDLKWLSGYGPLRSDGRPRTNRDAPQELADNVRTKIMNPFADAMEKRINAYLSTPDSVEGPEITVEPEGEKGDEPIVPTPDVVPAVVPPVVPVSYTHLTLPTKA